MKKPRRWRVLCAIAALAMAGCGLIAGTVALGTAAVVGTVGVAGYTVYKGGEAVVSGAGKVGSSAKSLVVSDGALEAESMYPIAALFPAAEQSLTEAGFMNVSGKHDSLAGRLVAKTVLGEQVSVKLTLVEKGRTAVRIKVGEGHLEQAEYIYDQMLAKLEPTTGGVR